MFQTGSLLAAVYLHQIVGERESDDGGQAAVFEIAVGPAVAGG